MDRLRPAPGTTRRTAGPLPVVPTPAQLAPSVRERVTPPPQRADATPRQEPVATPDPVLARVAESPPPERRRFTPLERTADAAPRRSKDPAITRAAAPSREPSRPAKPLPKGLIVAGALVGVGVVAATAAAVVMHPWDQASSPAAIVAADQPSTVLAAPPAAPVTTAPVAAGPATAPGVAKATSVAAATAKSPATGAAAKTPAVKSEKTSTTAPATDQPAAVAAVAAAPVEAAPPPVIVVPPPVVAAPTPAPKPVPAKAPPGELISTSPHADASDTQGPRQ